MDKRLKTYLIFMSEQPFLGAKEIFPKKRVQRKNCLKIFHESDIGAVKGHVINSVTLISFYCYQPCTVIVSRACKEAHEATGRLVNGQLRAAILFIALKLVYLLSIVASFVYFGFANLLYTYFNT